MQLSASNRGRAYRIRRLGRLRGGRDLKYRPPRAWTANQLPFPSDAVLTSPVDAHAGELPQCLLGSFHLDAAGPSDARAHRRGVARRARAGTRRGGANSPARWNVRARRRGRAPGVYAAPSARQNLPLEWTASCARRSSFVEQGRLYGSEGPRANQVLWALYANFFYIYK